MYAGKKRKRPSAKIVGTVSHDDAKSTPSKRHRDRLNGELDKLTALLPFSEEIRGRLDKLSVLRLSVGFLKVKTFLQASMREHGGRALSCGNSGKTADFKDGFSFSEGALLLQALDGFVLVVSAEGCIFYASPTVQDYLGFHQSDLVQQSVYELIHVDDRGMFQSQLRVPLNPKSGDEGLDIFNSYSSQYLPLENSALLERSFCCRFRCLLDGSSGFLALNFQGRLKYLHEEDQTVEGSSSAFTQIALFAIASPVHPPGILEIRTKTLIFQTKHRMDFAPLSIDTRGKMVLGYTESELCLRRSGYQFIHAADMMHCADNHLRMIKTGESGFTVFRLLTKDGVWVWVQANARVVFKGDKPDFIIARQKPLTNEEGEEHLRQRQLPLPFSFAGEAALYENLEVPKIQSSPSKSRKKSRYAERKEQVCRTEAPNSLLGSLLRQDSSIYIHPLEPETQHPLDKAFLDSHALLSIPSDGRGLEPLGPTFNQDSMLESLETILGQKDSEGALKDLEVDQVELREWEDALLRIHLERGGGAVQLNDILANDVFSYVEEALLKETDIKGYYKQTKPQETEMRKGEILCASQNKPMEMLQNCMFPRDSGKSTILKPGGYGVENQSELSIRNINDTHAFLGQGIKPLHSRSLHEGISCGSLPATASFHRPFHDSHPQFTDTLGIPSIQQSQYTEFGLSTVFQSSKQNLMSNSHGQSQHPTDPSISQPLKQQQTDSQIFYDAQKDYVYHHTTSQQSQPYRVFSFQPTVSQAEYSHPSTAPQSSDSLDRSCRDKRTIAEQLDSHRPPV